MSCVREGYLRGYLLVRKWTVKCESWCWSLLLGPPLCSLAVGHQPAAAACLLLTCDVSISGCHQHLWPHHQIRAGVASSHQIFSNKTSKIFLFNDMVHFPDAFIWWIHFELGFIWSGRKYSIYVRWPLSWFLVYCGLMPALLYNHHLLLSDWLIQRSCQPSWPLIGRLVGAGVWLALHSSEVHHWCLLKLNFSSFGLPFCANLIILSGGFASQFLPLGVI